MELSKGAPVLIPRVSVTVRNSSARSFDERQRKVTLAILRIANLRTLGAKMRDDAGGSRSEDAGGGVADILWCPLRDFGLARGLTELLIYELLDW